MIHNGRNEFGESLEAILMLDRMSNFASYHREPKDKTHPTADALQPTAGVLDPVTSNSEGRPLE